MRNTFRLAAAALTVSAMALSFTSCGGDDDDDNLKPDDRFGDALEQLFPEARNVEWEQDGKYRVAEFRSGAVEYDVWFDDKATWKMTGADYGRDLTALPDQAVVQALMSSEYSMWQVDDIDYYRQPDDEFYIIEVEQPGSSSLDMDLYYSPDGTRFNAIPADMSPDIRPETVVPRQEL